MHTYLPKTNETLKRIENSQIEVEGKQSDLYREDAICYITDNEFHDVLSYVKEHDELKVDRTKSIEIVGLYTEEEIERYKRYELMNVLKIVKVEHSSIRDERVENEDLSENINSEFYYVTAILHVDETEPYIEHNVIELAKN